MEGSGERGAVGWGEEEAGGEARLRGGFEDNVGERRILLPSAGCMSSTTRWCRRIRCEGRGRSRGDADQRDGRANRRGYRRGDGRGRQSQREKHRPGHERGLAMALDGNGRWCWLNPKEGAKLAVAEAARKVACTGATPVAATNCLNFGNPEKPEIMRQLSDAIDGIAEACIALGTPVTGGNVIYTTRRAGRGFFRRR